MAALLNWASQSTKFEPSSFKDTRSMKARSHESRESGAEVREVEVDIIKSTTIKHGISIKNSREKT